MSKFIYSLILSMFLILQTTYASTSKRSQTIYMNEDQMVTLGISLGRSTILNFPIKPNKVVLGDDRSFVLEYIENDLAISAIRPGAQTNLFVYLQGRRFGFNLIAVNTAKADVNFIRDSKDKNIKYEVKDE